MNAQFIHLEQENENGPQSVFSYQPNYNSLSTNGDKGYHQIYSEKADSQKYISTHSKKNGESRKSKQSRKNSKNSKMSQNSIQNQKVMETKQPEYNSVVSE